MVATKTKKATRKKKPAGKVRSRRAAESVREKKGTVLDLQLGSMSVGKTTAGLGFKIDRNAIGLEDVDALLVGARLDVEIATCPGQAPLFDGAIPSLDSVADVHKLSVGTDGYSGKLTFRREDTDLESLSELVSQSAQVTFRRIGEVKTADEDGDATPKELDAPPLSAGQ